MINSFRLTLAAAVVTMIWWFAAPNYSNIAQRNRRAAVASSYSTCTAAGQLSLTISDTPTSEYITALVTAVQNTNVQATWFVTTSNIRNNNALRGTFVNLVNQNKLQIGLTYPQATASQTYDQIQALLSSEAEYMNSIFGSYPLAVRFLANSDSSTAIKAASDMGMYTVQYGIDTLLTTAEQANATTSVDQHMQLAFDGAIPSKGSFVVMHHDATSYAVQVTPTLVSYAQNKLYTWVPLSTCLGVASLSGTVAPAPAKPTTAASGSLPTDVFPANWSFAVFFIALMLLGPW